MNKILVLFLLLVTATQLFSQSSSLRGSVRDSVDQTYLIGGTIVLREAEDTTKIYTTVTDEQGGFEFISLPAGRKELIVEYIGYKSIRRSLEIREGAVDAGTILLVPSTLQLRTVTVEGKQVVTRERGDTTEYNANAFKTNPDANAQDLISKMPGISVENGSVKAQGENVTKVLVDGKEFFGDDPSIALQNLPADAIDKVQVLDRQSDQSQYTGFDDGNTQKTINIITKTGKVEGNFGKVYGGYGTDDRYSAGGNFNKFKGTQRLSVLGMINNVNQQNFSSQDLAGVTTGGGRSGGSGGGRGGSGGFSGGGGSNNFLTGQQSGINTTKSLGLNYSETYAKKLNVSLSYFLNDQGNNNQSVIRRNYIRTGEDGQVYNENSSVGNRNQNHRLSGRIEYLIDSFNTVLFSPRLNFQATRNNNLFNAITVNQDSLFLNNTNTTTNSNSLVDNYSGFLLYNHKFRKKSGRNFTVDLNGSVNNRTGVTLLTGTNFFADTNSNRRNNQRTDINTEVSRWDGNVSWTEPISKASKILISYGTLLSNNVSDRITRSFTDTLNDLSVNPLLSNKFENTTFSQKGGLGYSLNVKAVEITLGLN